MAVENRLEGYSPSARIAFAIATWFGCGLYPVAPGTVASLAALFIALGLEYFWHWHGWAFLILAVVWIAPGIWAADVTAKKVGREDPTLVVIDEVIGQWITLAGATVFNWKSFLAALFVFRVLDVFKPGPIRRLEALPGGLGIVADDVLAGIFGALVIFIGGHYRLY